MPDNRYNNKIYINTADWKTIYTIYKNGKAITKNEYVYIEYLNNNYFIACNSEGKLGVIDENENTKIAFNYNSIQKIEGTDLVQTTQNDTNTIEIYSKDLSKITELKNGNIEKHADYIKLYNNDEIKETNFFNLDGSTDCYLRFGSETVAAGVAEPVCCRTE